MVGSILQVERHGEEGLDDFWGVALLCSDEIPEDPDGVLHSVLHILD